MRITALATAITVTTLLACSSAERQAAPSLPTIEASAGALMTPHEMQKALIVELPNREPVDRTPVVVPGLEDQWSDDIQTLEVGRSTVVREDPMDDADLIGVIVRGTRVRWRGHVESSDCEHTWIELVPRGWICAPVKASKDAESTETLPRLGKGRTPGTVGQVRRAGMIYKNKKALLAGEGRKPKGDMVALSKRVRIDGVSYWRTRNGQYVEAKHIGRFWASDFGGVELGLETGWSLPLAFALSSTARGKGAVVVRAEPGLRAKKVRSLSRRTVVSVLETSDDGAFVRIGEGEWVARTELRIAEASAPPSETIAKQRWLDVDLENQVVVAYEGTTPVYVTLTSTGGYGHRTPTGVFRVARKKSMTTMNSARDSRETYSVANVPWTLYFHQGYALHGAYWHDGFGRPRSHGCVNLSPADAKRIYEFLGPEVPAGWSQMVADADHPGSAVRVRNAENPTPEFRGYAAELERGGGGEQDVDSDATRVASR